MKQFAILCVAVMTGVASAESLHDHLVPVDETSEASGEGAEYRKLYEQKLFVSPGDVARYVYLPPGKGTEAVASVYQANKKDGGMPGGFWVTFTQASDRLWDCIATADHKQPRDSQKVRVDRVDAPIPESTARALHEVWLAMLKQSRQPSVREIDVDSDILIFSATDSTGRILRARAHSLEGNNWALVELGDRLFQYCNVPIKDRSEIARKIEGQASVLLKRLARK